MTDTNERLGRIEVTTENIERRLDGVEHDVREVIQKVNSISLKWTVLITCAATAGSAVLQLILIAIAKSLGLS